MARCNLCVPRVGDSDPIDPLNDGIFRVPWDHVGAGLMAQHLKDSHKGFIDGKTRVIAKERDDSR